MAMDVVAQSSSFVNKICRTCLSSEEPFFELFNHNPTIMDDKITLCDMLLSVAYIEAQSGDGLPEMICQNCIDKVNVSYNFKILSERSDAVLREAGLSDNYIKIEGFLQQGLLISSSIQEDNVTNAGFITPKFSLVPKAPSNYTTKLLPSRPLLQVGPGGVRVLPKSEVDNYNLGIVNNDQSNICNDVKIEEIDDGVLSDSDFNPEPYKQKKNQNLKRVKVINKSQRESDHKTSNFGDSTDQFDSLQDEPETFSCLICSQTFKARFELCAHKKTHPANMRHQCPHCSKSFSAIYTLKHHIATHSEYKAHLCPICGKRFHHVGGLQQHIKYHKGVKPHPCRLCDKRYYSIYLLREHVRCAHSNNRYNYLCTICNKRFTAKSTLTLHMKIHTGERSHRCEICGKGFTRLIYLREHTRKHLSQPLLRVFRCQYEDCTREFAAKASLQVHIRRKHTLERPYSCDSCSKSFSSRQNLNEHRRTHTGEKPEVCATCGNRFVNKQSLKKHIRLHTGERPYICTHCEHSFISASSLREHTVTKHTEKGLQCPVCGKKFHLNRILNAHLKTVHSVKNKDKKSNKSDKLSTFIDKQIVPEPDFEITL